MIKQWTQSVTRYIIMIWNNFKSQNVQWYENKQYIKEKQNCCAVCVIKHYIPPFMVLLQCWLLPQVQIKDVNPIPLDRQFLFQNIKPRERNIWKIINHHNHHVTIRTSLSVLCVINCTNQLIGDSETIYQIWPSKEDLHDD